MDNSSFFIKNKAMFGSYPTQQSVEELELEGVRYFINLTHTNETKIIPYITKYNRLDYPITDRSVPDNIPTFCKFIIDICEIIKNLKSNNDLHQKVYVHCRAGHGRSGIIVACILCNIFNLKPYDALLYTTKCHSNRSIMKDKWRKIGSPQTHQQKKFVYKLFEPININKIYKHNVFSHKISIENIDFLHIFHVYNFYKQTFEKDPFNKIFNKFDTNNKLWNDIKEIIMEFIVETSMETNKELKENLLNSYLRPIIAYLYGDNIWGIGKDSTGENRLGIILNKLRLKYINRRAI